MITLDSNIFLYLNDARDPLKLEVAMEVVNHLAQIRVPIALQVIGETQNVLCRKFKFSSEEAAAIGHEMFLTFPLVAPAAADVEIALSFLAAGRLSYWDALLVSTVGRAGCTALLTEDMQDGATILGVEIINPFGPNGLSARAAALLSS